MRTPSLSLILLLTTLLSCSAETQYSQNGVGGTGNIAVNNGDESGIGGTGKQVASGLGGTGKQDGMGGTGHQGLGGTGQIAKTSGLGGTGIIGEVTGFGSIFVNGIEVEIVKDSKILVNNKVYKSVNPGIGNIVEISAQRVGDEIHAGKINIRHEVVGPVDSVNVSKRQFTIINQKVILDSNKYRLPKPGDIIAVSGLRDQQGIIHATRLGYSKSKSVWLIDRITSKNTNSIKLGHSSIDTKNAHKYRIGDIVRVRANYRSGRLVANEILSNNAFGSQISHMVLQGFVHKGNRNNYKIGNIQFSTRSSQERSLLNKNQGRWTRVEVSRSSVGLWKVEQIIDNSILNRGSLTPQHSKYKSKSMFNSEINKHNSIHEKFDESMQNSQVPQTNMHSPYGKDNGRMKKNPMNSNKPPKMKIPKPPHSGGSEEKNRPYNMPSRSGGMM